MTLAAKTVRYIKLGRSGKWEKICLDRREIHFGHGRVPHELALTSDREAIKKYLIDNGRDPGAAADDTREILDFYTLGSDCLWATFARDSIWWAFAEPQVTWIGDGKEVGAPFRKCIGAWRNTDMNGKRLFMRE